MGNYGKEGSCYRDGTVEYEDNSGWVYIVFTSLLIFLGGAFIGSIIASTSTVNTVKEKYCVRYTDTQEYLSCIHKPIQEIYTLMEEN